MHEPHLEHSDDILVSRQCSCTPVEDLVTEKSTPHRLKSGLSEVLTLPLMARVPGMDPDDMSIENSMKLFRKEINYVRKSYDWICAAREGGRT